MTEPHAKCEDGKVWWRGSNEAFRYMPIDDAEALRIVMRNAWRNGDCGVPGYAEQAHDFAHDLTNAIEAYWEQAHADQ